MASTTGNNNDGGVHAATSHNLSTTKATVDTDLSNISQFIFLKQVETIRMVAKVTFHMSHLWTS